MTTNTAATVRITRRFDASAERVFDAWLDPKKAGTFLFATETGRMIRADIDARVGGSFCFVDRRDGEDVEHTGTYLEIDRPRRLVFTFSVPKYSAVITRVTIVIEPLAAGCELTLTHDGVLPEYASRTQSGWSGILEGLASAVSRKEAALSFLRLVASGNVHDAYRAHIGPGFRHHNPFFRGDVDSLRTAMEENATKNPSKVLEVQRALEDGVLVAVHSRVRQTPDDRGAAVVHFFRFANDRIVELWDVGQAVPETSPNEHGMF
jgi:uncharacterized protein YndB with AHSA1/START domain/predicted SnoaL-like aldol condensation-catalyzing enzyme